MRLTATSGVIDDGVPPPSRDPGASVSAALRAGLLDETHAPTLPASPLDVTAPPSRPDVALGESRAPTLPASPLDVTAPPSRPAEPGHTLASQPSEVTAVSGTPPAPLDDDAIPRRIGRFVVLRRIGRGGMGSVFAAYDEELARRVAIKVLHAGIYFPAEGRAPIVAEAQAMARLSHANVVQVYELGEHEGDLFFAMEFVEGRTLGAWLKEQPRPWPDVVRLMIAAGQGLAAAHRAGIVHRDFKPDNVLVDQDGVVRVADFGLARPATDGPTHVAGTPAYMSPEQLLGDTIDARSDQFSLCVALYVALYDQAPFPGDNLADLTASVTAGALRPPPAGTAVPAGLHATILRGLAIDRERRFPTTEALLDELRGHLPREAPARWPARLVIPLILLALALAFVLLRRPPSGPTLAQMHEIGAQILRARVAAGRAEWVYPAEGSDPKATAIRTIVDLEHLPAPAADYARGKADALRAVFADDLAAIGERYWQDAKTRPFARDFYAQVLVFRPDHALALQRSRLTLGQMSDLRAQAEETAFTAEQLAVAAPLRILATTTDPAVIASIVDARDACGEPVPATSSGGGPASRPPAPAPDEPPPAEPEPPEAPPAEAPAEAPPAEAPPAEAPPAEPPAARPASPRVDAADLIEEAENARRRGQDGRAAVLFQQALAASPRDATALAALSDIAFDRGDFAEAADFAERAIKAAPAIGEHYTRLGDAHFKLQHIDRARAHFQRALALGDPRAQRRLDLLDPPKSP